MRVLEILLSQEQRDRSLSPEVRKEVGDIRKKIDRYLDIIKGPGTRPEDRAFFRKQLSGAVANLKSITESGIFEAVYKVPLTHEDFDYVKDMMERAIPAGVASIYLQEIIVDDELNEQLAIISEEEPNRDIRPFVVEWIKRVMPDQMYRFTDDCPDPKQKAGTLSPLHGYDPHMYKHAGDAVVNDTPGRYI